MRSLFNQYGALAISMVAIILAFILFFFGIGGESVQKYLGQVMYKNDADTRLTDSNSVKDPIVDISKKNNNGGVNLEVRSSDFKRPLKIYAGDTYSINNEEDSLTLFVNKGTDELTSTVYALRIRDQNNKPLNTTEITNGDLRGQNEITFPSLGIYYIDVKAIDTDGVETVGTMAVTVNSRDTFYDPDT